MRGLHILLWSSRPRAVGWRMYNRLGRIEPGPHGAYHPYELMGRISRALGY